MTIHKAAAISLLAVSALLFPASPDFVFPTGQAQQENTAGLAARRYGDQAMADGLYDNAVKYFTDYSASVDATSPEAADACIRLAEACNAAGKPAMALENIVKYMNTDGRSAAQTQVEHILLLEGTALNALKRYDEAFAVLKQLATADADMQQKYPALRLAADTLAAQQKWSDIVGLLQPALEVYPENEARGRVLRQSLARAWMAQGKYGEAVQVLNQLTAQGELTSSQALPAALLMLQCQAGAGNLTAAIKLYDSIAAAQPAGANAEWHSALRPLAELCGKSAENAAAMEKLSAAALKVAGGRQEQLEDSKLLAEAMILNGHTDNAMAVLAKLRSDFKDAPEIPAVTLRLAELQKAAGKNRSAAELFQELFGNEKLPQELRFRAAMQAADAMKDEGELDRAQAYYRQSAQLSSADDDAARSLKLAAECAEGGQHFDQALALLMEIAEKYSATIADAANARLEAGRLLLRSERRAEALEQFRLFIAEHPDSPEIWNAKMATFSIRRRLVSPQDKDSMMALCNELLAFAAECPATHLATQGYFDACQCAMSVDEFPRGIEILNMLLERFPDGEHAQLAMHRNIMLCLRLNRSKDAVAMARQFLQRFPGHKAAGEIALHCGDSLQAEQDWNGARQFYGTVTADKYGQEAANEAAYEIIHCDWKLGETEKAIDALRKMLAPENSGCSTELLARAAILLGDILSSQSNPEAAREQYAAVRNFAGNTALGYLALARQAEMMLSYGIASQETLQQARNCLKPILENTGALPPELRERARHLDAKCAAAMGNTALALATYQELVTEYIADRQAKIPHTPKYYALSVWEMVALLEKQEGKEQMRLAAHTLENYAATGLPRAQEAARKAGEIRQKYGLGQAGE